MITKGEIPAELALTALNSAFAIKVKIVVTLLLDHSGFQIPFQIPFQVLYPAGGMATEWSPS